MTRQFKYSVFFFGLFIHKANSMNSMKRNQKMEPIFELELNNWIAAWKFRNKSKIFGRILGKALECTSYSTFNRKFAVLDIRRLKWQMKTMNFTFEREVPFRHGFEMSKWYLWAKNSNSDERNTLKYHEYFKNIADFYYSTSLALL